MASRERYIFPMLYKWLFLLPLIVSSIALATEVDNFTNRDIPLNDSRETLNEKMNLHIAEALVSANKLNCATNEEDVAERFYSSLDKKIGGFFWAKYEKDVDADSYIDKRHFKKNESVYRGVSVTGGVVLSLAKLGSVVNVGGNLVGTDKLGHFCGIGKVYFDKIRTRKGTLKEVLRYGEQSEETFFGLATTGIYSYGDLVSNYEGLRFWQSLFAGEHPYLRCMDGKLAQTRAFDWLDYVNDAWDESLNCSRFRTEEIKEKVYKEIRHDPKCPVMPLRPETIERYSNLPIKLLSL